MEMILLSAPILGFVGLLLVVGTRRAHSQAPARIDATVSDSSKRTITNPGNDEVKNLIMNIKWSIN